jgi:hypothetical protein
MQVNIDFNKIKDWASFHKVFAEVMGFPEFYGNNNAWIDCMSYIDDSEAGMSEVTVKQGENLNIHVTGTEVAINNAPEIILGFISIIGIIGIIAVVNKRFIETNSITRINITVI